MFWFMYISIGIGVFRSLYEGIERIDNVNFVNVASAAIVSAIWPAYWGYRITEKIDNIS